MKEEEIRPKALFDEYLKLAEQDVKTFFRGTSFQFIPCPACDNIDSVFAFNKKGFNYDVCPRCNTLFVNPRPPKDAFEKYYQAAPSVKFWATRFYKETESARREAIFKPRAKMVLGKIRDFTDIDRIKWLADVGAGYGIFCEEVSMIVPAHIKVLAIEPSPDLAKVCVKKGLTVVNKFLGDVVEDDLDINHHSLGVMVSFELFEHLHNPGEFLLSCRNLLQKGSVLIFTAPSGTGFDIQVLWKDSKNVSPPHHLNFFNPGSVKVLLERSGFEALEVTTPGKLDVDIVENNIDKVKDRFIKTFLQTADPDARDEFQGFLQRYNLSSHMMVVARKG